MKLAVVAGYAGGGFSGSQYQPDARTVEGEFIRAGISCGMWQDAASAQFRTAGRTDKGVSVRRQLISVCVSDMQRFREAINFHLPPDIWCLGCTPVDDTFYPRYAAKTRTYRYYFPYPLDTVAMNRVASSFVGTRDFSGFSRMEAGRDPVRTVVSARVFEEQGLPVFEVTAKSFLWNMVRGMAGFLFAAGLGMADAGDLAAQMESPVWRVHPAPAEGLILWDFDAGLTFEPVKQRTRTDRELFEQALQARQTALTAEALLRTGAADLLKETGEKKYGSLLRYERP